jgi:GTP-sensing pleiotropic transcriptional regulator CodY
MLNFHEQKLTLGDFLETQKQSALEEAEEPEPEPQERTRTVVKLTEGLSLIAVLIKVFDDIDWKEYRLTKTILGIIRMLACCEDMLKEKKSISPDVFYMLNFHE